MSQMQVDRIAELEAEIARLREENTWLRGENTRLREQNARLKDDVANFERMDRMQRASISRLNDKLAQKTLVLDGRATTELAGLRRKKREGR